MTSPALSHLDKDGHPRMVDVGAKSATFRTARAEATVRLGAEIADMLTETGGVAKGNVIETARIAGIMATKRTAELIPMCHPLPIDHVALTFELDGSELEIAAEVRCQGRTGVEMEALTAVSIATLTVYDMCKSVAKDITVNQVRLIEKTGGKSGHWRCDSEE
ncbi:MAG: cyclic pyranopterin monophosphate synthase MoaC [Nitrospiraceae bacterium]|nr:cyclic pyranopterin monophosphate synthase MoaC [Nitrospiraceae bacterium]